MQIRLPHFIPPIFLSIAMFAIGFALMANTTFIYEWWAGFLLVVFSGVLNFPLLFKRDAAENIRKALPLTNALLILSKYLVLLASIQYMIALLTWSYFTPTEWLVIEAFYLVGNPTMYRWTLTRALQVQVSTAANRFTWMLPLVLAAITFLYGPCIQYALTFLHLSSHRQAPIP